MRSSIDPLGARGWSALIADDDDDARSLLASSLRRAGFDVAEARDGEQLVELFTSLRAESQNRPTIVVSDIGMPGCDGLEATRVLRSADPSVPVVLVTAFSDAFTLRCAQAAGASVVLSKPLDSRALVDAVVQLAARPDGQRA